MLRCVGMGIRRCKTRFSCGGGGSRNTHTLLEKAVGEWIEGEQEVGSRVGSLGGTIAVALSGGVDSGVTAAMVKEGVRRVGGGGVRVVGVHMMNWDPDDEEGEDATHCGQEEDREDAERVAQALGLDDFVVLSLANEYWVDVFQPVLEGYAEGRTPNPDMGCNAHIKFGALVDRIGDVVGPNTPLATGHYASSCAIPGGEGGEKKRVLASAVDERKDQTYFLARTPVENVLGSANALFPLGGLVKNDVRAIALDDPRLAAVAEKRESMGICFVGKRKFGSFLSQYLPDRPGNYVHLETGEVVGTHRGLHSATVGQRARLGGLPCPMYVSGKDIEANVIYLVDQQHHPALLSTSIQISDPMLFVPPPSPQEEDLSFPLLVRTRHGDPLTPARYDADAGAVRVRDPIRGVAPGQVAALYASYPSSARPSRLVLYGSGIIV